MGHKTIDEKSCAVFELSAISTEPVEIIVTGDAKIAKDGGGSDETDSRGNSARLISWQSDGTEPQRGASLRIDIDGEIKLTAVVEMPDAKAVSFTPSFEEAK